MNKMIKYKFNIYSTIAAIMLLTAFIFYTVMISLFLDSLSFFVAKNDNVVILHGFALLLNLIVLWSGISILLNKKYGNALGTISSLFVIFAAMPLAIVLTDDTVLATLKATILWNIIIFILLKVSIKMRKIKEELL